MGFLVSNWFNKSFRTTDIFLFETILKLLKNFESSRKFYSTPYANLPVNVHIKITVHALQLSAHKILICKRNSHMEIFVLKYTK